MADQHKKMLIALTNFIIRFENAMDKEMKKPSTPERGRRIARLTNALTIQNQKALRFGLGYSFKKIEKMYDANPLSTE